MNRDREDQVVAHLRVAFQEEASQAIARIDLNSRLAEFGARIRKDRQHRGIRAIAACLALAAGVAAAIGITHAISHPPPVTHLPAKDPGGPRLNDPNVRVPQPEAAFTGQGRRYLAQGFGPEFAFVEPPAPWRIAGPASDEARSYTLGRPERGALYLVRGDSDRSTERLTFLIWRNVLDDYLQQSPMPRDLASWLAGNPHLTNVGQQPDAVSGMPAVRVDAKVASIPSYEGPARYCNPPLTRCLLIADNADQPTKVGSGIYRGRTGPRAAYVELGALVRFWIIRLPTGEQLVIQASAQPANFDAFIGEADQIVQGLIIAR